MFKNYILDQNSKLYSLLTETYIRINNKLSKTARNELKVSPIKYKYKFNFNYFTLNSNLSFN